MLFAWSQWMSWPCLLAFFTFLKVRPKMQSWKSVVLKYSDASIRIVTRKQVIAAILAISPSFLDYIYKKHFFNKKVYHEDKKDMILKKKKKVQLAKVIHASECEQNSKRIFYPHICLPFLAWKMITFLPEDNLCNCCPAAPLPLAFFLALIKAVIVPTDTSLIKSNLCVQPVRCLFFK